ncbi:MAG: toprim domain-containing protein, partial [Pseudomonadota bacterium]
MNKVYPDHLQAYKDFAFDRIQNKVVFLSRLKDGEQRDVQGFQAMCSLGWSVAHNIVLETEFRKCFLEAYHANGLLNDKGEHSFDGALRRALRASINDPLPKLPSKYLSRKTKQKKHFSDAHLLAKGYKLSDFYTYTDAKGTPVFEKCKYVHPQKQKKFLYRHQEHNNGLYFFGKGPHPDYPFGLTDLLSQKDCPVLVCEGEKDAQNAKDILGLPAVSINDWKACTSYFEGRDVYIVPDQDKAGRQKAKKAYTHLISVARSAIIVNLQCAEGEDFTDWLNQDKSIEDFWALVAAQQEQHPTQPLEIQTLMIEKCSPHLTVESISQILANTGQVFVRGGYIVELQPEHSLGEEEFRHRITDIR